MSGRPTCLVRSATGRPRLPPSPTDRSGVGFVNSAVADLQGDRAGAREADWRVGWPPSRWQRPVDASPSGLERKTRPAERRRSRRPERRLDRELHERREGRANLAVTGHPDGTEKSWLTLTHPLESALLCPPPCKVAAEIPEATGSGFPWKSVTTEFTNAAGSRQQTRDSRRFDACERRARGESGVRG
jgi:hypothetical protein